MHLSPENSSVKQRQIELKIERKEIIEEPSKIEAQIEKRNGKMPKTESAVDNFLSDEEYLTANESDLSGHSVEIPSDDERSISVEEAQGNDETEGRKKFFSNFPSPLAIFSQLKNSLYGGSGSLDANETNKTETHASSSKEAHKQESPQPPQIEETEEKWDNLFLETNSKTIWNCPQKVDDEQRFDQQAANNCIFLRLANKALQMYLFYLVSKKEYLKENKDRSKMAKMNENRKQQIIKAKDDLLEKLALKPSFLHLKSKSENNLSTVKIVLLRAFKHFNLQRENRGENEFKIITENFINFDNCIKMMILSNTFQKKETLEMPIDDTMKRYRKALEKIKTKMEEDDDYCTNCKIPTVEEIINGKKSKLMENVKNAFKKVATEAKKKGLSTETVTENLKISHKGAAKMKWKNPIKKKNA
ncbi:hypothetical protein niasHT_014937 [Heterodera trifolii]|uniref:Uncharacterized protein n=1 Tax=Heterodera trifolii TaxID=157864 RepID=A0ABD2LFT1_9BILA